jgi:hypothetical protein
MSAVRKFRVKSRLARIAFAGGGVRVKEALNSAGAVMDAARPAYRATLEETLETARRQAAGREMGAGGFEDFYALCGRLIELSWCVGSDGFTQAAYSLCDLVDRCSIAGEWDWPGLDVHMSTLRFLCDNGSTLDAKAQAAVLEGLRKVNLRIEADPLSGA